jgi:hypothetical protein
MKHFALYSVFCLQVILLQAQQFAWKAHFNYNRLQDVETAFGKVFAASELGILVYDEQSNQKTFLDKTNGLSDIDITAMRYIAQKNILCIGYRNGAINFIDENLQVTANLLVKQNYNISGSKKINGFYYDNTTQALYIASDYGILKYNLDKNEITETYLLRYAGILPVKVNDLISFGDTLYAATDYGLYKANIHRNLLDFNEWENNSFFAGKDLSNIIIFGQFMLVNETNPGYNQDNLYRKPLNGGSWQLFIGNTENKHLSVQNNRLLLPHNYYIDVLDTSFLPVEQIDSIDGNSFNPNDIAYNNGIYWVATESNGLAKCLGDNNGEYLPVNAPITNTVQNMEVAEDALWIATGNIDSRWFNQWQSAGVINYTFKTGKWLNINQYSDTTLQGILDIVSVKKSPGNDSILYFGTWGNGLIEFTDNQLSRILTDTNSGLKSRPEFHWVGAYGFDWDNNGSMWISNSFTDSPLVYYNPRTEEWAKYAFLNNNEVTYTTAVGHLVVDSIYGYKWLNLPLLGEIVVFDDNQTPLYTADNRYIVLDHSVNSGHLPGYVINDLLYYAGKIWVATDAGLVFFDLTQTDVFNGTINAGYGWENSLGANVPILENAEITAILFTNNNNMWLGTRNNGIYHLDENWRIQHHFTSTNSPLTDNNINDLIYSSKYNTYFVATQRGILSFSATPETLHNNFETLLVYPNPASNQVTVTGLAKDVAIDIFSIDGRKIFSTQIEGNVFTWNLRNYQGQRVLPGMYFITAYRNNFPEKRTAKLLITQ